MVLSPVVQHEFVDEAPDLFTPIAGGWGRMDMTHIRLAAADEETLRAYTGVEATRRKKTSLPSLQREAGTAPGPPNVSD